MALPNWHEVSRPTVTPPPHDVGDEDAPDADDVGAGATVFCLPPPCVSTTTRTPATTRAITAAPHSASRLRGVGGAARPPLDVARVPAAKVGSATCGSAAVGEAAPGAAAPAATLRSGSA